MSTRKPGNFKRWLKQYLKDKGPTDPITDLAADIRDDECFPESVILQIITYI